MSSQKEKDAKCFDSEFFKLNCDSSDQKIFEIYKIHFENIMKDIDRRQKSNNFYLTVNLAIFTFWGSFYKGSYDEVTLSAFFIGFCFSIIWLRSIYAFKDLLDAKFEILNKMEEMLPCKLHTIERHFTDYDEKNKLIKIFDIIARIPDLSSKHKYGTGIEKPEKAPRLNLEKLSAHIFIAIFLVMIIFNSFFWNGDHSKSNVNGKQIEITNQGDTNEQARNKPKKSNEPQIKNRQGVRKQDLGGSLGKK